MTFSPSSHVSVNSPSKYQGTVTTNAIWKYLRDILGLVPDHHSKVSVANMQVVISLLVEDFASSL